MKTRWTRKLPFIAMGGLLWAINCPASQFSPGREAVFVAQSPGMVDVSHSHATPFGGHDTGFSAPDKRVVWVLQDWRDFNGITAVQTLDDPGIPETPGQSEH